MQPSFSIVIPYDVVENIIGFIDQDLDDLYKKSLCACSLVCRAWSPIAQAHLFRTATVKCLWEPGFVNLVTENPRLQSCVRSLSLTLKAPGQFTVNAEMNRTFMEICGTKLPRLDALQLNFPICEFDRNLQVLPPVLSQFHTITTLGVCNSGNHTIQKLLHILADMPHIQHLFLDGYSRIDDFLSPHEDESMNAVVLSKAQTHPGLLSFAFPVFSRYLIRDILTHFKSLPIRTLILFFTSFGEERPENAAFLKRFGQDIECLSLCLEFEASLLTRMFFLIL